MAMMTMLTRKTMMTTRQIECSLVLCISVSASCRAPPHTLRTMLCGHAGQIIAGVAFTCPFFFLGFHSLTTLQTTPMAKFAKTPIRVVHVTSTRHFRELPASSAHAQRCGASFG